VRRRSLARASPQSERRSSLALRARNRRVAFESSSNLVDEKDRDVWRSLAALSGREGPVFLQHLFHSVPVELVDNVAHGIDDPDRFHAQSR